MDLSSIHLPTLLASVVVIAAGIGLAKLLGWL